MKNKNKIYQGIPASSGIAIGAALVIGREITIPAKTKGTIEQNLALFYKMVNDTLGELGDIKERLLMRGIQDGARLIEIQGMILKDPFFLDNIEERVKNGEGVHKAIAGFLDKLQADFSNVEDSYLRERFLDIKDVSMRLLRSSDREKKIVPPAGKYVLIGHTFTPSDTAQMDKNFVLAFITEVGGKQSHAAIIAREMSIPAVIGIPNIIREIASGNKLIIDGFRGIVIVNPDEAMMESYIRRLKEWKDVEKGLSEIMELPTETIDGFNIDLSANIELPDELDAVKKYGAKGIGLFRSEFLLMFSSDIPDEEEQAEYYSKILKRIYPDSVIIRTFDIGGDKLFGWTEEQNPFLGWRGIRLSLGREEIFRTQIRAILKASSSGNVKIMLPMVSTIDEVKKANSIIKEEMENLKRENIKINDGMEIGIMAEVPSVAIRAKNFAKYVDFFSIGSNDLTQYTLAVDRTNEKVANIFDHLDPSILHLIKTTIEGCHNEGKWVGICGEIAGDILAVPVLIGLGIDELSVIPSMVPEIKSLVRSFTLKEAKKIASYIIEMEDTQSIRKYLYEVLKSKSPSLTEILAGGENDRINK